MDEMKTIEKMEITEAVEITEENVYKIEKAQWDNIEHECLVLAVLNETTGEKFQYACRESEQIGLNRILWELAMENEADILLSEVELILSGEKELPQGKRIIDMTLYDDAEKAIAVKSAVSRLLSSLTTPQNIALAKIDPEFDTKITNAMKELLNVEKQETFPYDIIWPEMPI
jgi:transcriptional regulator